MRQCLPSNADKEDVNLSLKAGHPEWASRATVSLLRHRGRKKETQWVIFLQTLSPPSTDRTLRRLAPYKDIIVSPDILPTFAFISNYYGSL